MMLRTIVTRYATVLVAAALFGAGLGTGWALWHPRDRVVEPPALAQRQADSSLVLERAPDAHAAAPAAVPHGSTLERVVHVVVQPRARVVVIRDTVHDTNTVTPRAQVDTVRCPPVRVDLALVRQPDHTRRVIASSPDGIVLGGVDVPVESAAPPRVLHWAIGATRGTSGSWGAFLDREAGPLRLRADVFRPPGEAWQARLGAGIRF